MEENKTFETQGQYEEERSSFNFMAIYQAVVLNWYWFVLTVIISVGAAYVYLRYTTPTYRAVAKLLIKENNDRGGRSSSALNTSTLGVISNTSGIDNEIEILSSNDLAAKAIRGKKLYVTYYRQGRIKDMLEYKYQPIVVDLDDEHLDELTSPIRLTITRDGKSYNLTGTYYAPVRGGGQDGPYTLDKKLTDLPATITTRAGRISIASNNGRVMKNGETYHVTIMSPHSMAYKFAGSLSVEQSSQTTSIAMLSLIDESPERAIDYLNELALVYNQQANDDKNEVATKTDRFINSRLARINSELGETEGALQSYKQRNGMVELKMNATQSMSNQNESEKQLNDISTQIALLSSITDFMNESSSNLDVIPSNIGLTDASCTSLIEKYNELVLERKRLLRSASENSPVVEPITEQIRDLRSDIRRAVSQSRHAMEIQRGNILSQYDKYNAEVAQTPQQERDLTQIGRQQEVMSGLYLMLLQKREENNISLAATANKGQLIDEPQFAGQVSPKRSLILLIAFGIGLAIPALILFLLEFFRYKIEGHEDVEKLTKLPIIADVAVASDSAKTKADIVVHENQNNTMEEIFRSLRTNLLFMFREDQKVAMLTSSTSGEGKTFIAANLAISLALLNKKAVLVGLDIRKPRLAELFELHDHKHGITNLLAKTHPTLEDVRSEIVNSGINDHLDLLMAGPIPPNPSELLERESLDEIFQSLRKDYDYIIVDTAPVGLVTDTLSIGRVVDATICVCRADYTDKHDIVAFDTLSLEKKLPNMSIVINGIDMSKKKYGYRYGYGRYGKYGRYGYGRKGYGYGYGNYSKYTTSHYGQKNDKSIKR